MAKEEKQIIAIFFVIWFFGFGYQLGQLHEDNLRIINILRGNQNLLENLNKENNDSSSTTTL